MTARMLFLDPYNGRVLKTCTTIYHSHQWEVLVETGWITHTVEG